MVVLTAVVLSLMSPLLCQAQFTCEGVGYFPDPADCSKFYRCTDIYGNGLLQTYMFECPAGTVFDIKVSVCNWPWAVPSCSSTPPPVITSTQPPVPETTTAAATTAAPAVEVTTVVAIEETTPIQYTPAAGSPYECGMPGIVEYEPDCQKFWLCKENPEGSRILESLLYRCPAGYLFSSSSLRCAPAADMTCLTGAAERGLPAIQLSVQQLDQFFARFG